MLSVIRLLIAVIVLLVMALVAVPVILVFTSSVQRNTADQPMGTASSNGARPGQDTGTNAYWKPADLEGVADPVLKKELAYGRDIVAHTAMYFGPRGSVQALTNGMNCQNCHLKAGTAVFGNNFGSVASMYPTFRARSGRVETIVMRVNDCFERSLNGQAPDSNSREMKAIVQYISFVGKDVPHGQKAAGSGLKGMEYLDRAADPTKGQQVFIARCASCHQADGSGMTNGTEYAFPPLWGEHSFNDAAGLNRISQLSRYVKYNMPQGTQFDNPLLTDEEAWDVAAYIVSMPRPHKATPNDWPDLSKKPVDHPVGPYTDTFPAKQHKYGPFKPILEATSKKSGT